MALFVTTIERADALETLPKPMSFGSQRRALVHLKWGSSAGGAESTTLQELTTNKRISDVCGIRTIQRIESVRMPLNVLSPTAPVAIDYWIDAQPSTFGEPLIYVSAGTAGQTYDAYVMVYGF